MTDGNDEAVVISTAHCAGGGRLFSITLSTSTGTCAGGCRAEVRAGETEMAGEGSLGRSRALEACCWASRLSCSRACCLISSCRISTRDDMTEAVVTEASEGEPSQTVTDGLGGDREEGAGSANQLCDWTVRVVLPAAER